MNERVSLIHPYDMCIGMSCAFACHLTVCRVQVAVAKEPKSIFVQFSLCYGMMPLLALMLGKAFTLNPALLAGTVLVGCINGGQVCVSLCCVCVHVCASVSSLRLYQRMAGMCVYALCVCIRVLGSMPVPVWCARMCMRTCMLVFVRTYVSC